MVNKLTIDISQLVNQGNFPEQIKIKFRERIQNGKLSRDENPRSHFCIYFPAYDFKTKKVFLGHHKKSGLWLVNGGHIDQGEDLETALIREIKEEWGIGSRTLKINKPLLLSITDIEHPEKIICETHFDIWYFIKVEENVFHPDKNKLQTEFYENKWLTIRDAKKLVTDKNNLQALDFINNLSSTPQVL